jgi:hypothetical protein
LTLADEMPQRDRFYGRQDYYDDIGFAVVAEFEGCDILMGAIGAFYTPDGRCIPIKDQLVQPEVVENIIAHTKTMAGPDPTPSW